MVQDPWYLPDIKVLGLVSIIKTLKILNMSWKTNHPLSFHRWGNRPREVWLFVPSLSLYVFSCHLKNTSVFKTVISRRRTLHIQYQRQSRCRNQVLLLIRIISKKADEELENLAHSLVTILYQTSKVFQILSVISYLDFHSYVKIWYYIHLSIVIQYCTRNTTSSTLMIISSLRASKII